MVVLICVICVCVCFLKKRKKKKEKKTVQFSKYVLFVSIFVPFYVKSIDYIWLPVKSSWPVGPLASYYEIDWFIFKTPKKIITTQFTYIVD